MRHLFYTFFLACSLLLPSSLLAQSSGWPHIEKASQHIEKGNYHKAELQLQKAEKGSYGFCGNAWAEAYKEIAICRSQILMAQNKPQLAYHAMDSIGCFLVGCEDVDSVRIAALIAAHGKEVVAHDIHAALKNVPEDYELDPNGRLYLAVGFQEAPIYLNIRPLFLHKGYRVIFEAEQNGQVLSKKEKLMLAMREMPLYSLLK